ncbi:AMP-binding protein [Cryobacterium sp. Y57]|uniref:AMP-binding protein n=1 Tax=Cryobacterium sp. Y57 TaxID=2048287 RepID=UPI000CE52640|nr:AMP-binding protein [Cryobacterium sp. Y57]
MTADSRLTPFPVSYAQRIADLATERGERTALIFIAPDGSERSLSWAELDARANQLARLLADRGVGPKTLLAICLPTRAEHIIAAIAGWRLGSCTLPLSPQMTDRERAEIIAVSESWRTTVMLVEQQGPHACDIGLDQLPAYETVDASPLPAVTAWPGKAICSGGSTGRPKIILDDRPWQKIVGQGSSLHHFGLRADQTQLVTGRLYHNIAFSLTHNGLFEGHTVILLEKFDAALTVDVIERYRVSFLAMVPIVMQRIARLPDVLTRDFSSIDAFYHSGAVCPVWVKRVWLQLVDPARQYDCYGGAEGTGVVAIRGDEWMLREGSLGRPVDTRLSIRDSTGAALPAGEIGEIFTGHTGGPLTFRYLGTEPLEATDDGLVTLGDLGWLDDDGYLYLADRRVDLIITGGANVYPAEVEGVLSEHPGIADAVVIGIDDDEWGKQVYAILLPTNPAAPPEVDEVRAFCRERLVPYKVPKTFEFVTTSFRDESGKMRRSALASSRNQARASTLLSTSRNEPIS